MPSRRAMYPGRLNSLCDPRGEFSWRAGIATIGAVNLLSDVLKHLAPMPWAEQFIPELLWGKCDQLEGSFSATIAAFGTSRVGRAASNASESCAFSRSDLTHRSTILADFAAGKLSVRDLSLTTVSSGFEKKRCPEPRAGLQFHKWWPGSRGSSGTDGERLPVARSDRVLASAGTRVSSRSLD